MNGPVPGHLQCRIKRRRDCAEFLRFSESSKLTIFLRHNVLSRSTMSCDAIARGLLALDRSLRLDRTLLLMADTAPNAAPFPSGLLDKLAKLRDAGLTKQKTNPTPPPSARFSRCSQAPRYSNPITPLSVVAV